MSDGSLYIKDSRTSREYEIPIHRNTVLATAFKKIKASLNGANKADKVADGLRLYDPGLQNTTVVETGMTYTDSERGLLLFRGYALEQLWDAEFEDMLHLMVWGKLPTLSQRESLRKTLATLMANIPEHVVEVITTFPKAGPIMPMIVAGLSAYLADDVGSIPAYNGGNIYHGNIEKVDEAILKTVAAFATVVGLAASHRRGIKFKPATTDNTYHENLFIMMGLVEPFTERPDPLKLSCFRRFAVLNADHGMALSSFSLLVTASSLTDPISGLIGSLAAAYGPLHFGAPEAAYKTLQKVGSVENVPAFLDNVRTGKQRLFGYGHRTYKTVDPRVKPIKDMLVELDADSDPLLQTAREIDRLSSTDEYFLRRGLHANADFYGTFFFVALGFTPEEIPIAMLAQRIVGIMAHYRESMLRDIRLFRPTHVYIDTGIIVMIINEKSDIKTTNKQAMDNRHASEPLSSRSTPSDRIGDSERTPLLRRSPEKYSQFTGRQKLFIVLIAAFASTFSPFSSNIYYPAINSIARDLNVNAEMMNLTITAYMVFQGLAPTFMGNLSDSAGRRPVYMLCFSLYIITNIALALQNNYWALVALRALQSTGISATVALSNAVAADVVTPAERGTFLGIASLGGVLGPALGPTLGGLMSEYWGWRMIFWFLAIVSAVFFIPLLLFFPETCRKIVGDGSVPPPAWNRSLLDLRTSRKIPSEETVERFERPKIRFPNPITTLRLLFQLPTGPVLFVNGIGYAAYYAVTASIPSQWTQIYHLNDLQLGMTYIPIGLGTIASAFTNGWIVDWNFRRVAAKQTVGMPPIKNGKPDLSEFPIERARLQITLPTATMGAVSIAGYGLILEKEAPISVALVFLFLIGYFVTSSYNVMNVLIVDLNLDAPATATAANNMVRCFLGAVSTAAITWVLGTIGRANSFNVVAAIWIATVPLALLVYIFGWEWRRTSTN
ncbi:hypothetical protein UA08_07374 [Talaromyces atroroseus]|uniref:Citrate synthase n=1 Tax=Talaromyces atroroseus TaxID=1441469 RepID=A0A225A8G5_TALAT|nr:hypothetical protein UA08_07374 [Talaromyces atroroseus]OKL57051.1 hypothetical protein UA08_07374 [Talaromyces atroroseus]